MMLPQVLNTYCAVKKNSYYSHRLVPVPWSLDALMSRRFVDKAIINYHCAPLIADPANPTRISPGRPTNSKHPVRTLYCQGVLLNILLLGVPYTPADQTSTRLHQHGHPAKPTFHQLSRNESGCWHGGSMNVVSTDPDNSLIHLLRLRNTAGMSCCSRQYVTYGRLMAASGQWGALVAISSGDGAPGWLVAKASRPLSRFGKPRQEGRKLCPGKARDWAARSGKCERSAQGSARLRLLHGSRVALLCSIAADKRFLPCLTSLTTPHARCLDFSFPRFLAQC